MTLSIIIYDPINDMILKDITFSYEKLKAHVDQGSKFCSKLNKSIFMVIQWGGI